MDSLPKRYCLITVIEANYQNIDSFLGHSRLFEDEALKCFQYWRLNGGCLSKIPIYAVCPTKNKISSETKKKFVDLNVNYIEHYFPETENYKCGFWNKPLGCMYLENLLSDEYDIFIHIDLDMFLLCPLNLDILKSNSCLIYDRKQRIRERFFKNFPERNIFNTCFVVSEAKSKLFTSWYEKLHDLPPLGDYFYAQFEQLEFRKIEELSFDLLAYDIEIHQIDNLIFGETYTDVRELNDSEISSICFHHHHIYEKYSEYKWLSELRSFYIEKKRISSGAR